MGSIIVLVAFGTFAGSYVAREFRNCRTATTPEEGTP